MRGAKSKYISEGGTALREWENNGELPTSRLLVVVVSSCLLSLFLLDITVKG